MSKDPYRAGPCPMCGEYAVGTYRHPDAPVFCKNKHEWQRKTLDALCVENAKLKAEVEQLKAQLSKRGLGIHQTAIEHGIDLGKCSGTDPDTICPPAMTEDLAPCMSCKYSLDALVDCRDCERNDYAKYERDTKSL